MVDLGKESSGEKLAMTVTPVRGDPADPGEYLLVVDKDSRAYKWIPATELLIDDDGNWG